MNSSNNIENLPSLTEQRNSLIKFGKNEDHLYGVYKRVITQDGSIVLEVVPDILCVNLEDISQIQWLKQSPDVTIVSGAELRKTGKLKYLAWKDLSESFIDRDYSRVSVGTIEIIPAKNKKWDTNIHIPTVHRGRTGYQEHWDQRTTTAGWVLGADLAIESLREAVEESSILGMNAEWKYELCLPTMDNIDENQLIHWMDNAIDSFLSTNGKYDLMLSKAWATKWDEQLKKAGTYARKVFWRNFHGNEKYKFTAEEFGTILQEIKNNKRYSFRKDDTLTQEQIDALGISIKLQKFQISEGKMVKEGLFWLDDDAVSHTPHAFRIIGNIQYPKWFTPLFRFYSESWVQYTRNPRIENTRRWIDTTGLKEPSSIDMKPVPFLSKFSKEAISEKVNIIIQ